MNDTTAQYAWAHLEGEKAPTDRALVAGDKIYDREGAQWVFEAVVINHVRAFMYCPASVPSRRRGRTCAHPRHMDGRIVRVLPPSDFGLYLGGAEGDE